MSPRGELRPTWAVLFLPLMLLLAVMSPAVIPQQHHQDGAVIVGEVMAQVAVQVADLYR